MKNTKNVLISSGVTPSGSEYKWNSIGDFIKEFTSTIGVNATNKDDKDTPKPNISNAVSGLPSAFARANMFTYALNSPAVQGPTSGLNSFYAVLLDEWKGLVSSFVLESNTTAFQVKRVWLTYSDKDGTLNSTDHLYEPKGAFGNSLFNRKQLWEDQNEIGDPARNKKPFIDIIYYNGQVVGGTSPESLLFTSPGYKFEGEFRNKVFIGENTGKYTDPLNAKGKLSAEELNKLFAYVTRLTQKISPFYAKYSKSKDLWPHDKIDQNIGQFLGNWISKIKEEAFNNGITLDPSAKPEVTCFELEPFKTLFNSVNQYYANYQGSIFTEEDAGRDDDCISFKLEDLLLNPDTSTIAKIDVDDISHLPINALEVDFNGNKLYFTIPLSPLGLRVFQREGKLESLINGKVGANKSSLIALYNANDNLLNVKLALWKDDGTLITQIGPVPFKLTTVGSDALGFKQMVLWPNFVSNNWGKYYLYSEMPHNSPTGWQAYPIMGNIDQINNVVELLDKQTGKKIGLKDPQLPESEFGFVRLAENGKGQEGLGKLLVGNIKTLSNFKYEIYESSNPIRGIELKNTGKSAGFIFIKYAGTESSSHVTIVPPNPNLYPTRLGIDFGSNNSCIAYYDGAEPQILQFKNRRISFFTADEEQNEANKVKPADAFEMLFFQNDEPMSNKIKTVLTLHDETRLEDDKGHGNKNQLFDEVVKGGFSCYESNIAIEDSTNNRHILSLQRIPDQKVQLVYNMKWSNDEREEAHKKAFLKSLLLQTYAELFMRKDGRMFPKNLAWAYPAAMSTSRIQVYSNNIWNKVQDCNPLVNIASTDTNLEVVKGAISVQTGGNSLLGSSGGMSGGLSGGISGGLTGGMTGGLSSGMTGGLSLGMSGGLSGGMTGGMTSGSANQPTSSLIPIELPDEIAQLINTNHTFKIIGKPLPVNPDKAMTESQAVACYAAGDAPYAGKFILGFDVGGSTTDLLAVTGVNFNGNQAALVKQNSIKLAAGSLADATKLIPNFNLFLKDYASRNLGKIYGLDNMTANTAPYYFNLILDKLDTKVQLDDFYRTIGSNCKPLMWINLYITGLNMFYGGMVARKLREHTERNPDLFSRPLSEVKLDFFGKGARIFDWYKALDEQNARTFLVQCFAKGFGEQEAYSLFNTPQSFILANFDGGAIIINQDNVKTEVAKGLARKDSPIFEFDVPMNEIAGEDGYMLKLKDHPQPISLGALMDINPSLIQRLGSELLPPQANSNPYPRFTSFIDTFYTYASQTLDFKADGPEVLRAIAGINILNDLRNDEDYKEANKSKDGFDFVAPLLILQGQSFLRSYLLPKIQKG
jgi:hypothetical protein